MIRQIKHRPTLLLTRPKDDADGLADELEALGAEVLSDPVLLIDRTVGPAIELSGYQAALITSVHAAHALHARTDEGERAGIRLIVVGQRTAAASAGLGFRDVHMAGNDALELCDWVSSNLSDDDGPLLYASGADVSLDLPAKLAHFAVTRIIVYKAILQTRLSDATIERLDEGRIDAVLHFSARSAQHFVTLCDEAGVAGALPDVRAYCLSEKVARAASENAKWGELRVAQSPSRGDILTMIAEDLKKGVFE